MNRDFLCVCDFDVFKYCILQSQLNMKGFVWSLILYNVMIHQHSRQEGILVNIVARRKVGTSINRRD